MSSYTTPLLSSRCHVLIVGFPAFGHVIPLLELAKKISHYHDVTLAISGSIFPDLKQRGLLSEDINDCPFQTYPIVDGVADKFDSPSSLGDGGFFPMFHGVLASIKKFINEVPILPGSDSAEKQHVISPVDVAVFDSFLSSAAKTCRERVLPYYLFQAGNTAFLLTILSLNDDTPVVEPDQADIFMQRPVRSEVLGWHPSMKDIFLPMKKSLSMANGIIINSCRETELQSLQELREDPAMKAAFIRGQSIHCVGPLLPISKNSMDSSDEARITGWLDRQDSASVIFISFGSVANPKPEQVTLIAEALLQLKRRFIWALRVAFHDVLPGQISSKIASQFDGKEERQLVLDWVPQKTILKHPAVGVFLSHCGWNSTLEALECGVPIVAWPMFGDQLANAQWLERLGVGFLVTGTGMKDSRLVPSCEIMEAVREASKYRTAARKWRQVITGAWEETGSSRLAFQDLIRFDSRLKIQF